MDSAEYFEKGVIPKNEARKNSDLSLAGYCKRRILVDTRFTLNLCKHLTLLNLGRIFIERRI